MKRKYQIVICGAGILGVSAAYHLARAGLKDILLLDERPPLTLTSDRSTECYRNWWPDAEMAALMNRSIDLMEALADESGNVFHMNRRGYLYLTADERKIPQWKELPTLGELRVHSSAPARYEPAQAAGFRDEPWGADMLLGNELIRKYYPYLTEKAVAALHVRRAGWLSAQQLGMYLLESARRLGVEFVSGAVEAVEAANGRVQGVRLSSGERLEGPIFVNAAGPHLNRVGRMLGLDLPVRSELHLKVAFKDSLNVVGRDAPLLIWDDEGVLPWADDERSALAGDEETKWMVESLPAGAHTRPEGGADSQNVLMLWEYRRRLMEPAFPPPLDDQFPEIVLRGLSTMLPRLSGYFNRMPKPQLDAGYYTKTRENRLLCGPLPVEGAHVIGAASGYGIMSACAAGELLAAHISGAALPSYAAAFSPRRYDDPEYQKKVESWQESGQL